MRWAMMVGILAALLGCAAAGVDGTDGGECSCPPGPRGPKGDKGERGEPGSADGSASGSRLTYLGKTLRGEDGSVFVQQGGFFDEELMVGCWPGLAKDGRQRCLPSGEAVGWFTTGYFVDTECTEPALAAGSCGVPPPRLANTPEEEECGPTYGHFREVGEEVGRAFRVSGGGCVEVDSDLRFFRLGSVMPPSAFVAFD